MSHTRRCWLGYLTRIHSFSLITFEVHRALARHERCCRCLHHTLLNLAHPVTVLFAFGVSFFSETCLDDRTIVAISASLAARGAAATTTTASREAMDLPVALTNVIDQGLELIYSLGPVFQPTVVLGTYIRTRARACSTERFR
jgi:hypothetical protein